VLVCITKLTAFFFFSVSGCRICVDKH